MILDAGRCLSDRRSWLAFAVGIFVGIVLTNIQVASVNGGADCARMASNLPLWQAFEADTDMLTEVEARNRTFSGEQNEVMSQLKAACCSELEGAVSGPLVGTAKSPRTNPVVTPNRSVNADLADLLEKVAINNELVVAVADNNVRAALQIWFESIKRTGFTNYMVVALDDDAAAFCTENDVPVHRRDAEISVAQQGMGSSSSKVSGLKFLILREFLVLGYSILLSDVDIIYLQNPFDHLYRDCDLESMTDGFDNATAYGANVAIDDPVMGWSRYAHTMRIFVFNSGLFYVRPTLPSIELLDRVIARLAVEKAWDQTVFNEELFYPSYPGYNGLHASRRVLDYYQFMNSKVLFLQVRKDPAFAAFRPVTIHVNYHHDKYERLLAIVEYYVNGNKSALDPFPDGSH